MAGAGSLLSVLGLGSQLLAMFSVHLPLMWIAEGDQPDEDVAVAAAGAGLSVAAGRDCRTVATRSDRVDP
jgi:hypothetical protein